MPNISSEYDVVVIGGGPAGSTTSTILAQGGVKVGLFEREKFPRFHIGESLIPETYWVLKRLNMLEKMQQQPLRQEVQRAVRQRARQGVGAVLLLGQQAPRVLADLAGGAQRVRPDDARQRPRARRGRPRRRPCGRSALRRRPRHRSRDKRGWPAQRDPRQGRRRRQRPGRHADEPHEAAGMGPGPQQGRDLDLLGRRVSRHRPRRRRHHGPPDTGKRRVVLVHPAAQQHRLVGRRGAV